MRVLHLDRARFTQGQRYTSGAQRLGPRFSYYYCDNIFFAQSVGQKILTFYYCDIVQWTKQLDQEISTPLLLFLFFYTTIWYCSMKVRKFQHYSTTVTMLFYPQKHGPERAQTQAATVTTYPTPGPGTQSWGCNQLEQVSNPDQVTTSRTNSLSLGPDPGTTS